MKIKRPRTEAIQDTEHKRFVEDLYKLTLRNISFGTLIDGADQNIQGKMIDVPNTGGANVEFSVVHNLLYVPLYYDVKYINGIGNVYASSTAWTKTKAFFKCNLASAHVRLFIH